MQQLLVDAPDLRWTRVQALNSPDLASGDFAT